MTATTVTIPRRFNGPPDSGNGGYTCGLVAGALGAGPAEVTLRAPPPLDRPLAVEHSDEGVTVRDGDVVVAQGRPSPPLKLTPPAPVPLDTAAAAAPHGPFYDAEHHPFPSCFVCGPVRAEGDGLRIFPGPVESEGEGDPPVFAAAWTPPASLGDDGGHLAEELVWAALDCPTSTPVGNDPTSPDFLPIVLARFAVQIERPVVAAADHVVVAWPLAMEGRKRMAASALYTAEGELCAMSQALWIELRRS